MTTYVLRDGRFVEKRLAEPLAVSGSAPYVISDIMPATKHQATGRVHDSKSQFRADTRAAGCIEVGDQPIHQEQRQPIALDKGQRKDAIRKAIYDLKNGYQPSYPKGWD